MTTLLENIRVIDLTTVVFGPYATQMLADMGADVIKVEPPEGDQMRQAGRPKQGRGMGPVHMTLNRGKRSIALDLKQPADAEVMRGLLADADVFVHNVRGAGIARLGFDYESVRAIRPDIIYVHCVGFGSDGPYAGLQAYDDVIQAATGTTTLLPRADGDARPRFVPSLIADKVSGLYGTQAVLAALFHRQRTGEGQLVEVPMFECFAQFMLQEHLYGEVHDDPVQPAGYPRQVDPHRQPFPTRDGWVSIVPYTAHTIARVFEVLEATEVFDDPRFATDLDRLRNVSLLYAEIARRTPARTSAEWVRILNAAGVPCMEVRDLQDIRSDPHLAAVDFFHHRDHPTEGGYVEMRLPIRFAAMPARDLAHPPAIDEHGPALRAEAQRRHKR
ncbi:CaiB/BaiF CoA-transferase family protein [Novosphingobium sp. EMRT-2]|uniref:CaiB/BaiF CoA transferase family protein n=1 Tax=Novosphingobium sp. EMRT-2 TaxID=2571749 RepID=UPI0010BDC416|nr:CoA transferase [Novosphingobium sp. EMRT-2]QCI94194.1 CoA transferase [Novosphingobium sp. EMRT-2]